MNDLEGEHYIRIENADIRVAGWITHYLYKLVDEGEVETIEVKKVKKSEESLDLIIIFILQTAAGAILTKASIRTYRNIRNYLRKWHERRKQTNLKIFLDGEKTKS